jgi:hypothetical protein
VQSQVNVDRREGDSCIIDLDDHCTRIQIEAGVGNDTPELGVKASAP